MDKLFNFKFLSKSGFLTGKTGVKKKYNFFDNSFKRVAFTLAEVLITLGIIGVVAAITMPTVINKHRERKTVAKVKKFYSTINQALLMSIKDNGYVDEWDIFEINEETGSIKNDKFASYFKPYLKILKDCGEENRGCIGTSYKRLNNQNQGGYGNDPNYY